jgi:hypothetical protein
MAICVKRKHLLAESMTSVNKETVSFRFSGHETFPCRYAWLPKAVSHLNRNPLLFSEEDDAMVALGVGKNMVRAIRFWADATGVAESRNPGMRVTELGQELFGSDGNDPFLEDIRTLWLVHWMLASAVQEPLFAWHYLLNFWHRSDFTRSEVLETFDRESQRLGKKLSLVTLDHHFTTFLHTYLPTRGAKGEILEDNLDCPLTELGFVVKVGDRMTSEAGRREPIYAFRVEEKPDIGANLFVYCVDDFWRKRRSHDGTLSFRDVAVGESSPGQVFKLPEVDIRERLETIERDSDGVFVYQESSALPQIIRKRMPAQSTLLSRIYKTKY